MSGEKPPLLDYRTPAPPEPPRSQPASTGCTGAMAGALIGGIVLPCGGFGYAAVVLHDTGGPLFWPIVMFAGAFVGAVVGSMLLLLAHLLTRPRRS